MSQEGIGHHQDTGLLRRGNFFPAVHVKHPFGADRYAGRTLHAQMAGNFRAGRTQADRLRRAGMQALQAPDAFVGLDGDRTGLHPCGSLRFQIYRKPDRSPFAYSGVYRESVRATADVGQAHARTEALLPRFPGGGGKTFPHGLFNIRDAGTAVLDNDFQNFRGQVRIQMPAIGMNGHIHFRFIHRHNGSPYNFGYHPTLAEFFFDLF